MNRKADIPRLHRLAYPPDNSSPAPSVTLTTGGNHPSAQSSSIFASFAHTQLVAGVIAGSSR